MDIRKPIIAALLLAMPAVRAAAQLTFSGSKYKTITEKVDANTGLDMLYVLYDAQGMTATYKASSTQVRWLRFSNLGGGYAEEVACTADGSNYSITLGADDMGYIIEDGTARHYCWVVNYANHRADLRALAFDEDQECDRARLVLDGNASKITYFTINGSSRELSRQMHVDYYTLKYNADTGDYQQVATSQTLASIDGIIGVFAPLCDTRFTLTGDKFLTTWGMEQSVESDTYRAIAVEAETSAEQEGRDFPNEQVVDAGGLGGSAPVHVSFRAAVTDAAIFREWQMARDPEFELIDDRFQQLDFDYTFRENGNTYVRFVANNADGSCEYVGETYEVYIGDSSLLCPNAFTPNGDGVNDEWKVSYRSIIEYECHIFNRWGQEIISMNNPSQGWDGRHNGKAVPTGVYYYVIKALGSDGRKYRLNGDINIIHGTGNRNGDTGGGAAPLE